MTRHLFFLFVILSLVFAIAGLVASAEEPGRFYDAIRANDLAKLEQLLNSGASPDTKDDDGVTPLMYSAIVGSPESMKLLIAKGAGVNVTNKLNSTALMWSATEIEKVRMLLAAGTDVNIVSQQGRNALFVAAMSESSAPIVKLLLEKGADLKVADRSKMTLLHAATVGNDTETIRVMVAAGLDVNAPDAGGFTPLMNASHYGNAVAVTLLLSKGADANAVSGHADIQNHTNRAAKNGELAIGQLTALMLASTFGPVELVKSLLDAGADINAKDIRGMTPLMFSVATDHDDPRITQMLLAAKPDLHAKTRSGETVLDWALKFGSKSTIDLLRKAGATVSSKPPVSPTAFAPVALKPALTRTVALLEKNSSGFFAKGGCVACHAQNITDMAVTVVRGTGIPVDENAVAARQNENRMAIVSRGRSLLERVDSAGSPDVPLNAMAAMAVSGYAPDRWTDMLIANLASQQRPDGRWRRVGGTATRPPISDGDILRQALAIRSLKTYTPPGRAKEMNDRLARATAWLQSAKPVSGVDHNMKLLGLYWAGVDRKVLQPLAKEIIATQRSDGGWGQRAELPSDAYGTGQSLHVLAQTGMMQPSDAAYQKGVQYLLSTQHADGSWYVPSRAVKFQPYFESGFPYGHDQWVSQMATGWAAMALAHAAK